MLLCSDCDHEVDLGEFPVHDACIRARYWNPHTRTRIDDLADQLDNLREVTMAKDPSQELFDSLTREVEAQRQAGLERQRALDAAVQAEVERRLAEGNDKR